LQLTAIFAICRRQREERQEYVENIIDLEQQQQRNTSCKQTEEKRFWSFIQSRRKDNVGIAPLKKME